MNSYLTTKINKSLDINKSKKITNVITVLLLSLLIIYTVNYINCNNNYKIQFINDL